MTQLANVIIQYVRLGALIGTFFENRFPVVTFACDEEGRAHSLQVSSAHFCSLL